jgi:geranylgeranyl pyrophosphate synthase
MSVTRLKRKHRKNIARANNKQHIIKELLRTPVLKNVDIEELKSRFTTTGGVAGAVAAVKSTATAAADKVEEVADSVAHSDVVEKAKDVVSDAVDAVKEAVSPAAANDAAANAEAFDDAEAVTKPVNEDGQEGEHPKPEIAL